MKFCQLCSSERQPRHPQIAAHIPAPIKCHLDFLEISNQPDNIPFQMPLNFLEISNQPDNIPFLWRVFLELQSEPSASSYPVYSPPYFAPVHFAIFKNVCTGRCGKIAISSLTAVFFNIVITDNREFF